MKNKTVRIAREGFNRGNNFYALKNGYAPIDR